MAKKKIDWFVKDARGEAIGRTTAELNSLVEGGRLKDSDKVRLANESRWITVREAKLILARLLE